MTNFPAYATIQLLLLKENAMQRLPELKTEVLPFNGLELHMTKQDFWSSKLRLQNDNWLFRKWWPVWQELGLEGPGHCLMLGQTMV